MKLVFIICFISQTALWTINARNLTDILDKESTKIRAKASAKHETFNLDLSKKEINATIPAKNETLTHSDDVSMEVSDTILENSSRHEFESNIDESNDTGSHKPHEKLINTTIPSILDKYEESSSVELNNFLNFTQNSENKYQAKIYDLDDNAQILSKNCTKNGKYWNNRFTETISCMTNVLDIYKTILLFAVLPLFVFILAIFTTCCLPIMYRRSNHKDRTHFVLIPLYDNKV